MSKKNKQTLVPKLRFPEFRDTCEWSNYSLNEIAERLTEKVGDRKLTTVSITAGFGFISQSEKFSRDISGQQYKNYILLKKGDFSFNKGNSKKYPQGCVYKLKEFNEAAAPNAFLSFRFKKEYVEDFYIGYFESNFHGKQLAKYITSGARSDGLLNINPDVFFSIKLPTPVDKKEQQYIADCLTSLDDLIIAEAQKLDAYKTHKNGLMQELFPDDGETVPNLRFREFRGKEEWEEKELGKIGEIISGLTYSPNDIDENGVLVLRSSNIQNNRLSFDDNVYVRTNNFNPVEEDDILICVRNGSHNLIGKNAIITKEYVGLAFGAFMTVYRSKCNKFLIHWFSSVQYYKKVKQNLGATINSINGTDLKKFLVLIPSPAEQQRIDDCLSSLDELITAQAQKVELLKMHKKGLMQGLYPKIGNEE